MAGTSFGKGGRFSYRKDSGYHHYFGGSEISSPKNAIAFTDKSRYFSIRIFRKQTATKIARLKRRLPDGKPITYPFRLFGTLTLSLTSISLTTFKISSGTYRLLKRTSLSVNRRNCKLISSGTFCRLKVKPFIFEYRNSFHNNTSLNVEFFRKYLENSFRLFL